MVKDIYKGEIIEMWEDDEFVYLGTAFATLTFPIKWKQDLEMDFCKLAVNLNEKKVREFLTELSRREGYR